MNAERNAGFETGGFRHLDIRGISMGRTSSVTYNSTDQYEHTQAQEPWRQIVMSVKLHSEANGKLLTLKVSGKIKKLTQLLATA